MRFWARIRTFPNQKKVHTPYSVRSIQADDWGRGNNDMSELRVILLVEDLEDDILLVRRAFAAAKLQIPLQIVRDGEEAIAYLMGIGKYAQRDEFPLPDLILLDLKMPKMDGMEVLRWIRSHPHLKALRVIV